MTKLFILAAAGVLAVPAFASAQDLSLDTRRMLSYGTTAVVVKACNLPITADENNRMMASLDKYAKAQTQMTPAQFTEAMQAAGSMIGMNKEGVCAEAAGKSVADMLAEAEEGE